MQIHPRYYIVAKADVDLTTAVLDVETEQEKAPDEMAVLLSQAISRVVRGTLKPEHSKLDRALVKVRDDHGLTVGELVWKLGDRIERYATYVVRYERHGTYDKKADEA